MNLLSYELFISVIIKGYEAGIVEAAGIWETSGQIISNV